MNDDDFTISFNENEEYGHKTVSSFLVNLDNGDIFNLGELYVWEGTTPVHSKSNIPVFSSLYMSQEKYDAGENDLIPVPRYFTDTCMRLNFFLAASRGCRLVVIPSFEFLEILSRSVGDICSLENLQTNEQFRRYVGRRLKNYNDPKNFNQEKEKETRKEIIKLIEENTLEDPNNKGHLIYRSGNSIPDRSFISMRKS